MPSNFPLLLIRRLSLPGPAVIVTVAGGMVTLSLNVLLPVIPILAEKQGPHGIAGAAIGTLFIAMVAGEFVAPWLMSRWNGSMLLVASEIMIAVSSLSYLIPNVNPPEILGAAFVRGFGTGLALVVCLALVTRLTSSKRRGTAIGYFGLVTGTPAVIFPSIGLWLLDANHLELAVAISFFAAAIGALLALFLRLPKSVATGGGTNILVAVRRPGILYIFIGLALFSCAYGGVFTYVPLTLTASGLASAALFFLISGACRAVGRWLFGLLGNSRSGQQILIGGIALAAIGLGAIAVSVQPLFVLFAAVSYGLGSGAVQTGSYLSLAERSTPSEWDMVSALWNIALDFGSATGSGVMGLAAATFGYSLGVWLMPIIVALSLPMVLLAGAHKPESAPALDISVPSPLDDSRK